MDINSEFNACMYRSKCKENAQIVQAQREYIERLEASLKTILFEANSTKLDANGRFMYIKHSANQALASKQKELL